MIIISLVYLNFIIYSRIIYPLIKMISKDDRLDGSRKESRLRKKKKEKPRTSLNLEAKDESRKELGLFLFPEKLS